MRHNYFEPTTDRWKTEVSMAHSIACCVACILGAVTQPGFVAAQERQLPKLPPGVKVVTSDAERWNRVVLVSQPQLVAGDVGALANSIREMAGTLWVSIMATVAREQQADGLVIYRLMEVGVGTSAQVEGQLRVITLDNAAALGVSLGLVKRQLLIENERQFRQLRLVANTSTLVIFDAPAILLREGKHVDRTMRHLVWIDSRTGAQAALVWLLERREGKQMVSDEPARWLKPATLEQRRIHVDKSEFTLGIPGSRAFALMELPPGTDVQWDAEVKPLAALDDYSMEQLAELSRGMNRAIRRAAQP
jgi:hypothetical protein